MVLALETTNSTSTYVRVGTFRSELKLPKNEEKEDNDTNEGIPVEKMRKTIFIDGFGTVFR